MKLLMLVHDDEVQFVAMPETDAERRIIEALPEDAEAVIYKGTFSECQGGWVREFGSSNFSTGRTPTSLLIRTRPKAK